ncbi:hypothetical protein PR048_026541 [Dryococelus australis]|uniref:Uncharacterized protein n=1 Tax=Dryococelus australis TaxID=614101 RepID=A0ABQ9GLM4_9NEOP|nr:hypothetical protein PR048_026541 [Dryococelus australis]
MYWLECVVNKDIDCFPLTKRFLDENNIKIQGKTQNNIQTHLEALKDSFDYYFPTAQEKVIDDIGWVKNVFNVKERPPSKNPTEYEVLVDLTS